jgi:adenylate cyclase
MTAIGDAVNFASRIESANKEFGTTLLVSADVYAWVQDRVTISASPISVEIKGKTGAYSLYEVVGIESESFQPVKSDSSSDRHNLIRYFKEVCQEIWNVLQIKIF